MHTFKILSAVLSYPSAEIQAAALRFPTVLDEERLIRKAARKGLAAHCARLANSDLVVLQEDYVALFDGARSLSLHLFEHIHGDSRDRGQAMVDLREHYRRHGLDLSARELPDYLPLFLEFLSTRPSAEAIALLGEVRHVLVALQQRLAARSSHYADVFAALADMAGESKPVLPGQALATDDRMAASAAARGAQRDADWQEMEVRFGPDESGNAGCPVVSEALAEMRARRPSAAAAEER